ncbi:single-stranded-DNA-specific exonuclease RecJ [Rickettsiales bacterium LUAb2]
MNNKISVTGKTWISQQNPNNIVELLVEKYGISNILANLLLNRNINQEKITYFLDPKLRNFMIDPSLIKDMDNAILIMLDIILNKQSVYILGDYDVDGMTSTAILYNYLTNLEVPVNYYIPNRFSEGYGGGIDSVKNIITQKPSLVIMVDNGSSSIDEIELLRNNNIKVIVLDHHVTQPLMPNANALVNPNRLDDTSNLGYLCAGGLVFLFLVALNRALNNNNYFSDKKPIDLLQYLDLVAMATVCDMVPLTELNRAYVTQGIKILISGKHVGLSSLLEVLNFNNKIDAETLGFTLGPIINAASRLGKEHLAIELLTTRNPNRAIQLAVEMKELNQNRQAIEDQIINQAVGEINNIKLNDNDKFIFIGNHEWSKGLVGIVAGRIKEIHHKPTCVYAVDASTNIATASGRSIPNLDLGSIVIAAKQAQLLTKGGGHSQAVGFSFNLDRKEEIFQFFNEKINRQINKHNINPNLQIDADISLTAIDNRLIIDLLKLQPFGVQFSEPIFKISRVFINNIQQIGAQKNHLAFEVTNGYKKVKGIAFKAIPSILGENLLKLNNQEVDIVVTVKANFYKGNTYPNLILLDISK